MIFRSRRQSIVGPFVFMGLAIFGLVLSIIVLAFYAVLLETPQGAEAPVIDFLATVFVALLAGFVILLFDVMISEDRLEIKKTTIWMSSRNLFTLFFRTEMYFPYEELDRIIVLKDQRLVLRKIQSGTKLNAQAKLQNADYALLFLTKRNVEVLAVNSLGGFLTSLKNSNRSHQILIHGFRPKREEFGEIFRQLKKTKVNLYYLGK